MGAIRTAAATLGLAIAGLAPAWAQDPFAFEKAEDWPEHKAELAALGRAHATAWELFEALREEAGGGTLSPDYDDLPDWTGVWTREGSVFFFDVDETPESGPTARLTPAYQAALEEKRELRAQGVEYDPISVCGNPPGVPRWFTEPFLREFVPTPGMTLLINEMMNDVRRVYTDGREHTPEADRYPTPNGDTIGFWDGDRLVAHTTMLRAGQYQRGQPDYSDDVEVVEVWRKADDRHIHADVWVYDPVSLEEPWFARQRYAKLTDDDQMLRLRYWACAENQNNDIAITEEGRSTFADLDFTDADDTEGEPE